MISQDIYCSDIYWPFQQSQTNTIRVISDIACLYVNLWSHWCTHITPNTCWKLREIGYNNEWSLYKHPRYRKGGLVWRMSRFSISAYYRSGVGDSRLICLLSGGRFCYLSMALFMPWRTTYPHPDNLLGFYNSFKDPCFLVEVAARQATNLFFRILSPKNKVHLIHTPWKLNFYHKV